MSQLQEWELETGTSSLEGAQLRTPRPAPPLQSGRGIHPGQLREPWLGGAGGHAVSRQQSGLC